MTAKLVALYAQPDDPAAFERAYFDAHVPLAKKMPGLLALDVVKFGKNVMGGSVPYYMMAELSFADRDALKAALASSEGQAAGKNLMEIAGPLVTLLTSESYVPAGEAVL